MFENVTLIVFYTVFAKIKKQLHIKYLPRAECVTVWSVCSHASSVVLCCGQIPFTASEQAAAAAAARGRTNTKRDQFQDGWNQ